MCLLVLGYHVLADCPVFVAANREELFARPSAAPEIVQEPEGQADWMGGRDERAGGTWLGLNERSMLIAVTNRSDVPLPPDAATRSRGLLCRDLLGLPSFSHIERELKRQLREHVYAGFNLLAVSPSDALVLEAGQTLREHRLEAGLHVLTNSGLNTAANPRTQRARGVFQQLLETVETPAELVNGATHLCGLTADDSAPGLCLDDGDRGTVSSTIVTLSANPEQVHYLFANGPPDRTAFESYTARARYLLSGSDQQAIRDALASDLPP